MSLVVEPATAADDGALRLLLRQQEMEGRIRLSMRREPSYALGATVEGSPHHVVVGREARTGQVVAMASRAVRRVWLDGQPVRLGYLAHLRRAGGSRLGLRSLARGFGLLEKRRAPGELPFDLTSIMADNAVARRLLERGLPGLPVYRPRSTFSTLVFPVAGAARGRRSVARGPAVAVEAACRGDLVAIAACLGRNLCRRQLAPVWTSADLASPESTRGLGPEDFLVVRDAGTVRATAAVWDQRSFRQLVVAGYAPWLGRLRALVNVGLAVAGRPRLPAPGRQLDLGFLSHLAVDDDDLETVLELVVAAEATARTRGLDLLAIGLPRVHPWRQPLAEATRARELTSVLYTVHHGAPPEDGPDLSLAWPEVALL
jgi:hypothetical protein